MDDTMKYSPLYIDDKVLLLAMREGDKRAFEVLFRRYYAMLCAYGNRFVGMEDAEEIVQDVMLWLWESREMEVIEVSLNRYLFKAVYRRALNKIVREEVKHRADTLFYKETEEMLQDTDFYNMEELVARIEQAVASLPPAYSEAFRLHRFESKSYKEIAELLGVSVKTVDYRIQQALKLLRKDLKDYLPLLVLLWPC